MALILLDGMEDFAAFPITNGTPTLVTARSTKGIQCSTTSTHCTYRIPAALQSDTLTVGFAFKVVALPTSLFPLLYLNAGGQQQATICLGTDGTVQVNVGGQFGTLVVQSGPIVAGGSWYYVELRAKLHNTTGELTLRVNGVAMGTYTGDTLAGIVTAYDQVQILGAATAIPIFDDLYVANATGDPFFGDMVIETLYPNGNGAVNQWTGSDGNSTDNYLLVDEVGGPVITDYVTDTVVGHQDLYTLTDLVAVSGTIVGVCLVAHAAKADAATRNVKLLSRGASITASAAIPLTTSYSPISTVLTQNPETTAAWTIANVNALQAGVEVA